MDKIDLRKWEWMGVGNSGYETLGVVVAIDGNQYVADEAKEIHNSLIDYALAETKRADEAEAKHKAAVELLAELIHGNEMYDLLKLLIDQPTDSHTVGQVVDAAEKLIKKMEE